MQCWCYKLVYLLEWDVLCKNADLRRQRALKIGKSSDRGSNTVVRYHENGC